MRSAVLCLGWLMSLGTSPTTSTALAAQSAPEAAAPVLTSADDWRRMAQADDRLPLFAAERKRVTDEIAAAMAAGIDVPVPRDPGGGRTHEQHKRNYKTIYNAGALFRLTGDHKYAEFTRDMLLQYARLYPTLGAHPQGRGQIPGRLFWQVLNDSVWLVYAAQGYDAIRDALSEKDRQTIDAQVFRRMAAFLAGTPANFDRIHNHATWAVAGVGMTGYVVRDRDLIDKALLGSAKDGKTGFLRQIDQLFSPDGYYEEGPYYQRYALAPFVIFARAIEQNEPGRRIFNHNDGALLKAVDTVIQTSYAGLLLPINDAIKDKGLDSEEIVTGVAVAYGRTHDPRLLDIARRQARTILSPDGLAVAEGLRAGLQKQFEFRSVMLRDGAQGERGGLAILRRGGDSGQALVLKATAQGMGHGHFDKLNWLFYDNGHEIVSDYGSARFLNIEAKRGGTYLPENDTWAKQTIAHNTLVVNGRSHFDGKLASAEARHPIVTLFESAKNLQIVSARMQSAYEGVTFTRTMALLEHPDLGLPVVLDLLRVTGNRPAQYDLPLHYNGHIVNVGFQAQRHAASRPVLGDAAGYQHLWVDAVSAATRAPRTLTWLLDDRFYTCRFSASEPSQALLVESGANDPEFNLRREPALLQRVNGAASVSFVGVLEPHGRYDGTAETVVASNSRISSLMHQRSEDSDVLVLALASGKIVALAVARDAASRARHRVIAGDHTYEWTGAFARFDR